MIATESVSGEGGRALALTRASLLLAGIGSFLSPPVTNLGAVLAVLAFAAVPDARRRLRAVLAQPAARGVLGFLAVLSVSTLWADAPIDDRFGAVWNWRALLLMLLAWAAFTGETRWRGIYGRVFIGVLALCTVLSFVHWFDPALLEREEPGVLLRNHVTQGMAMVAGCVLVFLEAQDGSLRGARGAVLAGTGFLFLANIALVCQGRSGHLAVLAVVVTGALYFAPRRGRYLLAVGLALAAVALLAASPMVRERFARVLTEFQTVQSSPSETSTGLRVMIWRTSSELIAERPLLGWGAGGFAGAYAARIHREASGWQAAEAHDTHNEYLKVQVEAGLPGTLAFLAMIVLLWRHRAPSPYREGGLCLLAAWLVSSAFNSHFETFGEAHLLGLLLGVLLAPGAQGARSAPATAAATAS